MSVKYEGMNDTEPARNSSKSAPASAAESPPDNQHHMQLERHETPAPSCDDDRAHRSDDCPDDRPDDSANKPREIGGRKGPDPVRYGDWEKNGRCIDF